MTWIDRTQRRRCVGVDNIFPKHSFVSICGRRLLTITVLIYQVWIILHAFKIKYAYLKVKKMNLIAMQTSCQSIYTHFDWGKLGLKAFALISIRCKLVLRASALYFYKSF